MTEPNREMFFSIQCDEGIAEKMRKLKKNCKKVHNDSFLSYGASELNAFIMY